MSARPGDAGGRGDSADGPASRAGRWLAIVASVVVLATVVAAIVVMGSPSAQREAKLDARRAADLFRIGSAVDRWVERHDALPPDLAALAAEPGARLAIADPVSGAPYGYAIIEARSYEVCATFTTDTAQSGDVTGWPGEVWSHDVGPQCFERKVKAPGKDD